MFPNLKAEISRQNMTYDTICSRIGKKREWLEKRIQGKASLPVGEAVKIRNEFFPNMSFVYLYSEKPVFPSETKKDTT